MVKNSSIIQLSEIMDSIQETAIQRLKDIMKEQNLKQSDLLEKCQPFCKKWNVKFDKSSLSQYINGKAALGQEKIYILALALNVSEGWLLGYDVSPYRNKMHIDHRINEDFELQDRLDAENKIAQEIIDNKTNPKPKTNLYDRSIDSLDVDESMIMDTYRGFDDKTKRRMFAYFMSFAQLMKDNPDNIDNANRVLDTIKQIKEGN